MVDALKDFSDFVRTRMDSLKEKLNSASKVVSCPRCWNTALILGDGDPDCLFCGFTASARDVADEVGSEIEPQVCPECGGPCVLTYIEVVKRWLCYGCGEEGEYEVCESCGALYDDNGHDLCDECFELKIKAETGD